MLSAYIHSDRKFGLDLLRALAILQVVYGHSSWLLKGIVPPFPMFDGVELFFVLSGFLIGGILMEIKTWNLINLLNFWKNRWFRTLPNYYLFLTINVLLSFFIFKDIDQFSSNYLFFLQNFSFNANSEGWFAESWSLAVEEWFYLIIPCLIILISIISKRNAVLFSGIVLLISSFAFKFLQFENLQNSVITYSDFDNSFRKVTFLRFDAISLGIILAVIQNRTLLFKSRLFRNIILTIGLSLIICSIFIMQTTQSKSLFFLIIFNFTITIGFALSLPFFTELKIKCTTNLITKSIVWISLTSYSIYLIHYSIINKLIQYYFWPDSGVKALITFTIYFTLIIGLASLNFIFFEHKITKLRSKIKI